MIDDIELAKPPKIWEFAVVIAMRFVCWLSIVWCALLLFVPWSPWRIAAVALFALSLGFDMGASRQWPVVVFHAVAPTERQDRAS